MTNQEATNRLRNMIIEMRTYCDESKRMSETDRQDMETFDMAIKALENQTSVIAEIEKIKAEIENMWIKSAKDLKTGEVIYENLCEHSEVLEILANHISELKGEQK